METNNLHQTFAQSDYGQLLQTRTRFNDFKPDWTTTEQWCGLLGDDVNNLGHMPYTLGLAQRFTELSDIESTDLHITAITHDWGEAIIGDIPLPSKTDADETAEMFAYKRIARELLGEDYKALSKIVMPILFDKSVPEADMFRSIEYVGYCSTALKAGRVALGLSHDLVDIELPRAKREQLAGGLYSLHHAVVIGSFPVVKDYARKYAATRTLMQEVM